MMFIHTWQQVMDGSKSLTSRIVKSEPDGTSVRGEMLQFPTGIPTIVRGNGIKWCTKWQVGKTYAVQPGRGKPAIGHIQLLTIRQYDVRDITADEARREGFNSEYGFWIVWTAIHLPKKYAFKPISISQIASYKELLEDCRYQLHHIGCDEKFRAWQLEFKLITE